MPTRNDLVPGRWRGALMALVVLVVLAASLFWLEGIFRQLQHQSHGDVDVIAATSTFPGP